LLSSEQDWKMLQSKRK